MSKLAPLTAEDLSALGASESNIRWLDKPSAESICYLDLIESRNGDSRRHSVIYPGAVVEFEGQPLVYIVDNRALATGAESEEGNIEQTLRLLACRGDDAYLAVLEYGRVVVYPTHLKGKGFSGVSLNMSLMERRSLIQDLASETIPGLSGRGARRAAVHDLLFRLLSQVADQLLATNALSEKHDDVLALVGRALFARFLIDRNIMTPATFPVLKGSPEECFASPMRAAMTCEWLDDKFNGDLLPLGGKKYKSYFESFGDDADTVFRVLSNLMYRAPNGQLSFESQWGDLDFAHVPIGLLSEVYERYAHRHVGKSAAEESMHYTPRHIAEFMIEEAFEGLAPEQRHRARLLDPASGGGVFLTLGFRKLVAELWKANGRRPSRREIRRVLYKQIRGFDINSSALKLAALGLYLTALELDPNPTDPDELKFDPLFAASTDADLSTVLTHARLPNEPHPNPYVLGSLGSAISSNHRKQYDIVIGNPPWSGLSTKKGAKAVADKFHSVVQDVALARAEENNMHPGLMQIAKSYENPDGVPDIPFIWRSMEWAKDGGIIALALHARLLFKQADIGAKARDAVFTGLRVTGILNGAAVRKENVWPRVNAPWCLLFARNEVPEEYHLFHFVSIELEKSLNTKGRLRIDHKNAQPIQFSVLRGKPYLLKTMFRGTSMDAAVMEHLSSLPTIALKFYMSSHNLECGEGYKVYEDSEDQYDATQMKGMLHLHRDWAPRFAATTKTITKRFERNFLHRPRKIGIYRGPLMILPVSVPENMDQGCGLIARDDIAYSESFIGYSANGFDAEPIALACYLHVLTYSKLFRYFALMTSSQFGVERDSIQKEDVDNFPIIPFEKLDTNKVSKLRQTSMAIENEQSPWNEVDELVYAIYDIPKHLQQVIADTLNVSLPYTITTKRAEQAPSQLEIDAFCSTMEAQLKPLFAYAGIDIKVRSRALTGGSWGFLDIICNDSQPLDWDQGWLKKLADDQGASSVFVANPPQHIGVGILTQYRYWTASRAHMCALTIIREFSDKLISANVQAA
ncbi:MAG: N-6 DNA methylase [Sideroxyarcus sp.]|nr:N-6 DNA methylase [Sideroxyarcus sp.]